MKKEWGDSMEITIDRLKHSLAVAIKMKSLAETEHEKYPVNPDDMFVLGLLHDIGYEFSEIQKEHAKKGGVMLQKQGYRYWKEVYYHGTTQKEYDSPELRLLNYVDMITGPSGEEMTVQQRIENITKRYGKGSWQEKEAIELSKMINQGDNNETDDE